MLAIRGELQYLRYGDVPSNRAQTLSLTVNLEYQLPMPPLILGIVIGLLLAAAVAAIIAYLTWPRRWTTLDTLDVIANHSAGIHKRIDENRELLEHLQEHAPGYLVQFPWVVGWLRSQDEFLIALADASQMPVSAGGRGRNYVRRLDLPDVFNAAQAKTLLDRQKQICSACAPSA